MCASRRRGLSPSARQIVRSIVAVARESGGRTIVVRLKTVIRFLGPATRLWSRTRDKGARPWGENALVVASATHGLSRNGSRRKRPSSDEIARRQRQGRALAIDAVAPPPPLPDEKRSATQAATPPQQKKKKRKRRQQAGGATAAPSGGGD